MKLKSILHRATSRLLSLNYYKSYSQCGEDMIVRYYLPHANGTYVDIGAFHPKKISNTYHFYKRGWRGINIDASKEAIDLFKRYRPDDVNLNMCMGLENGKEVTFYEFQQRELNTFVEDELASIEQYHGQKPIRTNKMQLRTLEDVLDEHLKDPHIDLLNIDAEGADEQILQSNNWDKYLPKVIIVENTVTPEDLMTSTVFQLLKQKNYLLGGFSRFSFVLYQKDLI